MKTNDQTLDHCGLSEEELANMTYLSVRTFNKHQTYQFDNPGFVKLKTKLLFDDEFAELSEQAQLLYLKLLLHAAFTANKIPDSLAWMAAKLSMPLLTQESIDTLKTQGYLVDYDPDAPVTMADEEEGTGKKAGKKKSLDDLYADHDFQRFWEAYPNKNAKPRAAEKWAQLVKAGVIKPETVQTILDALERQKQSRQWRENNGEFIPLPSTWLHNRRWEDQGPSASTNQTGPRPVNLRVAL